MTITYYVISVTTTATITIITTYYLPNTIIAIYYLLTSY